MGANLKERVQARNGGEVATRDEEMTLGQYIKAMEAEFAAAMPKGAEAAQLVRDALTAIRTTKHLAECERASVLGGLMTLAQLNLRVGVLGHAWLLPFWDKNVVRLDENGRERKGGYKAQLIIGYQGYRELAQRTGQVASLIGRVVHENDLFDVDYGLADNLVHKPRLDGPRGEPAHYYCIVKYVNGGYTFWHITKAEAEEHRDKNAMAKSKQGIVGPWRDNFDEMAVKTAFLKLAKWMPKSTELAAAIAADGTVRVDLTPNADAMLHGEHPDNADTVDGDVVSVALVDDSHAGGHGNALAWSPDCAECEKDKAGEAHYNTHAEPEESCAYCKREAEWRKAAS